MRAWSFIMLLATGAWVAANAVAVPPAGGTRVEAGGTQVEVDRGGVRVGVEGRHMDAPGAIIKASGLIGLSVYNPGNESLGKIEDLVMNSTTGKIRYAVLSFGGFLGMGDKLFAVPWNELKVVTKGTTTGGTMKEDYCVLNVSKDALKNAPGFNKDTWPDFASANWSAEVERFYSTHRTPATGIRR